MINRIRLAPVVLLIAVIFLFPVAAGAGVFYSKKTDKCYEIVEEGRINASYVIYECSTCNCKNKKRVFTRFQSMSAAMDYLIEVRGPLRPLNKDRIMP